MKFNLFTNRIFSKKPVHNGGEEPLLKENKEENKEEQQKNQEQEKQEEFRPSEMLPPPPPSQLSEKPPKPPMPLHILDKISEEDDKPTNSTNTSDIVMSKKEEGPFSRNTYPYGSSKTDKTVYDYSTRKNSTSKSMADIKNILLSRYKYIENDQLNKQINLCNKSKTYSLYFCIYSLNIDSYIEGKKNPSDKEEYGDMDFKQSNFYPFLEFVVQENAGSYGLPTSDFTCPEISVNKTEKEKTDSVDVSQEQVFFENFCKEKILSLFYNNYNINSLNLGLSYKGFREHSDNRLFVFFDATKIIDYLKESYILAIVDELVYKKKIYSMEVEKPVVDFFKKNEDIIQIKTTEGEKIPFPFQLYMCKQNDGEYENIRKIDPIYRQIEHPFFNISYFFTTNPIINNDSKGLRRFACFIFKSLYLLKDIENELNEEEKKNYEDKIMEASTIYFHENGLQLWALKNVLHFTEY